VAFIGQRSGAPLQWRHISQNIEGHNIEDIPNFKNFLSLHIFVQGLAKH
jgi:hypothetical protein